MGAKFLSNSSSDLGKHVGVTGLFNASPIEIIGDGKVSSVRFVNTHTEQGKVVPIEGSEFELPCDLVIKATGQSKHTDLFSLAGLEVHKNGNLVVNDSFQTTNPKYYAAGDAVSGGEEVVNAAANGKKAALSIMRSFASS